MKKILYLILLLALASLKLYSQDITVRIVIENEYEEIDFNFVSVILDNEAIVKEAKENVLFFTTSALDHEVLLSYVGYKEIRLSLQARRDTTLFVRFELSEEALNQVLVTGKLSALTTPKMGLESVELKELLKTPILLGELDIQRGLQTLPGVTSTGEGANGLNIRGGGTDQNLLLLEGTSIYNPTHLFGLLSVVPSEAIKSINLYKGAIPSKYGGRVASVIELKTRDELPVKVNVAGGVGLTASKLSIEAPLIKGKLGVQLVGRASFTGFLLKKFRKLESYDGGFGEFYSKALFRPNARNQFSLMFFSSQDFTQFKGIKIQPEINTSEISRIAYAMENYSLRWNHALKNKRWFTNFIFASSEFNPILESPDSLLTIKVQNRIMTKMMGYEIIFIPDDKLQIELGIETKYNAIDPGNYYQNLELISKLQRENSLESAIYTSCNNQVLKNLNIDFGLRYSFFNNYGPVVYRTYSEIGNEISESSFIDSVSFSRKSNYNFYGGFEPRVSLAYLLSKTSSFKANFTLSRQFIQILANNSTPLPVSRWKTSDIHIKPQVGYLYSIGYYKEVSSGNMSLASEVYFRKINDFTDVKMGSDFLLKPYVETDLLQGENKSYGIETTIKAKIDKSFLSFNYTYSRSFNRFQGKTLLSQINDGNWYPSNFDRPHSFNLGLKVQQSPIHHFAFSFTYSSGHPYTNPSGIVRLQGKNYPIFLERNNARIPAYHRLDFSWLIDNPGQSKRKIKGNWSFNVYNLYARRNVYSVFINNSSGAVKAYQLSVLATAIPSISYNFKL